MNTYFAYQSLIELARKYEYFFKQIEEDDGVLSEEVEIKLKEIEDDFSQLAWDVLNMVQQFESDITLNKQRISDITKKNKSMQTSIVFLEEFLKKLIKEIGQINRSGNKNLKIGEKSLTVSSYNSYETGENFTDERFIRYNFEKIEPKFAEKIIDFLEKNNNPSKVETVILKQELNKAMGEGEKIEGVTTTSKDKLIVK